MRVAMRGPIQPLRARMNSLRHGRWGGVEQRYSKRSCNADAPAGRGAVCADSVTQVTLTALCFAYFTGYGFMSRPARGRRGHTNADGTGSGTKL